MTENKSSPEQVTSSIREKIKEIIEKIKEPDKENKITNPVLRFRDQVGVLSFENIFFVPKKKEVDLLLNNLISAEKIAVVVGGGVFSLSELLDVMKENPKITLFIAVDPECKDDDLFFTLREKSYFESKSTNPSQLGLIFPIKLESLPKEMKVDYIEMVSPSPLELAMLVQSGLNIIKEGGELRLYIPQQDLNWFSLINTKHQTNPESLTSSNDLIDKIKEHYRKIFKLPDNKNLEVKIISEKEAEEQRDSAHFGSFFYEDQGDSGKVIIISIKKVTTSNTDEIMII